MQIETRVHTQPKQTPLMPVTTQSIPNLQTHTKAHGVFEAAILWPAVPTFTCLSLPLVLLLLSLRTTSVNKKR